MNSSTDKYKPRRPKRKISAGAGLILNRVDIDQRPAAFDDRGEFGHWEGDTIVGADHEGSVVTMLEPKTRLLVCFPLNHRTKDTVADGLHVALGDDKDAPSAQLPSKTVANSPPTRTW